MFIHQYFAKMHLKLAPSYGSVHKYSGGGGWANGGEIKKKLGFEKGDQRKTKPV